MGSKALGRTAAEVTFGHCEFCSDHLEVQVMANDLMLTPFGECHNCRRFTIWSAVQVSGLEVPVYQYAA
jgi:hypothetical protein